MRPKTGEIVWHYQFTPNDVYDYDANWEMILADMNVDGQTRKVLMQLNRNGFLYVIDRTNGQLAFRQAVREGELGEPHRHGDRPPGRDRSREETARRRAGRATGRAQRGGKNWPHAAFNPADRPALRQHHASGAAVQTPADTRPTLPASATQFMENLPVAKQPGRAASATSTRSIR